MAAIQLHAAFGKSKLADAPLPSPPPCPLTKCSVPGGPQMAPQLQERKQGSTWEMWTSTLLFPHFRATACWLLRYHPGICLIHRVPLPFVSEKWMGLDSNLLSLVWLVNVNQWHKWERVSAQFHRAWTPLLLVRAPIFSFSGSEKGEERGSSKGTGKKLGMEWTVYNQVFWAECFTSECFTAASLLFLVKGFGFSFFVCLLVSLKWQINQLSQLACFHYLHLIYC